MRQFLTPKRNIILSYFCICIVCLGFLTQTIMLLDAEIESSDIGIETTTISYSGIYIYSDEDFGPSKYNLPGIGTPEDPYIIEGYTFYTHWLLVQNTTKHFIISNCIFF